MTFIKTSKGFTIIEIVVVIVITGIIAGLVALIIGRTVSSYHALDRRDKLQSSARYALERISRELRQALPNSVCTFNGANCNNSSDRLYFIHAFDAGLYQDQAGVYPSGQPRLPLPILPNTASQFDVISGIGLSQPAANMAVVVYNINNVNIYSGGANHIHPVANIDETKDSGAGNLISVLQFAAPIGFPTHSPTRRLHIIENNATLFYRDGTNLFRSTTSRTSPNTPLSPRLLLENVQALSFSYTPGQHHRAGLLQINLTVEKDGEQVQIIHEAHVYNVP
jgi:MSHA biogenesis protein MshO